MTSESVGVSGMFPVIMRVSECVWIWHTFNYLVHSYFFIHSCTDLYPCCHISPFKKLLPPPNPVTLHHSSKVMAIASATITTAETVKTGWLLHFYGVCLLISKQSAASLTQTHHLPPSPQTQWETYTWEWCVFAESPVLHFSYILIF